MGSGAAAVHQHSSDSSLEHGILGASKLALDLFAGPTSSLYRARHELAVGAGLLDELREPILSESLDQLSVGVGIREITLNVLAYARLILSSS